MSDHLRRAWATRVTAAQVKEEESPLDYHGTHPKRLALYEDGYEGKTPYFKDVPGLVAFVDYGPDGYGGTYIHYVSTDDPREGRGLAKQVIQALYDRTEGDMDWGRIASDGGEALFRHFEAKYPDRYHRWKAW